MPTWAKIVIAALLILPSTGRAVDNAAVFLGLQAFVERPREALYGEKLFDPKTVAAYYGERRSSPLWLDVAGKVRPEAKLFLDELKKAGEHGLKPEFYHLSTLELMLNSEDDVDRRVALELLLTDAFFAFAGHLFAGSIDPSAVSPDWAVKPRRANLKARAESAILETGIGETLRLLAPLDDRYASLKAELSRYREMKKFTRVRRGVALRPGTRSARVTQLRQRLLQEGYIDKLPEKGANVYDAELKQAVILFQGAHGLEASGVVGRETIRELNVPLAQRIRQIEVNLERLRWLPRELGKTYVFVDVAGFTLTVFENDEPSSSMRIIVGDYRKVTPMFMSKMHQVVLNPSWVVPKSIVKDEILPQLKSDPKYLQKKGIRISANVSGKVAVLDSEAIDWSQYQGTNFSYSFEAPSGPTNPMGTMKFLLPNDFSVYLHGTPDAKLFERGQRALSHGCIRVEKPAALASTILKGGTPAWSEAELDKAITSGMTISIDLPTQVPVYLWYRTAWVEDNRVQFRKDIYNWDSLLMKAMATPTSSIVVAE